MIERPSNNPGVAQVASYMPDVAEVQRDHQRLRQGRPVAAGTVIADAVGAAKLREERGVP